ncbi:MAG TPA: hypothetical protein VFZ48_05085 [Candidatus Saccharimonadales bacterium]
MPKNITDQAYDVAEMMVDWNYIPTLYVGEVTEIETFEDLLATIKSVFEDTEPFEEEYFPCTKDEMFAEIRKCFAWDEKSHNTNTLRDIPKATVRKAQEDLLKEIDRYITEDSEVCATTIEDGLPVVDIFWFFSYVIYNKDRPSLFIFGAASD